MTESPETGNADGEGAVTLQEQSPPSQPDPRRWWQLGLIGLSQLTILLDGTVVNIALPSAQADLGMTDANRQWVITAYALAFGGLLLLGGRLADMLGRKRTFLIGMAGFGVASALAGMAASPGMLFAGRALQGAFAALLAPAAMALLTTTFPDPKERSKAFGIFGAISGAGSAVGLIVGGLLTEYLDWRWCMYICVPIAVVVVVGGLTILRDTDTRAGGRLDVLGVLLGTGGLVSLVFGFSEAEPRGWDDSLVLGTLIGGVLLLFLFVVWQNRARHPLMPLRVLRSRRRAGSFLVAGFAPVAMFALYLFMTYYLQIVLDFSAVQTGLAFLPLTVSMILSSTQIAARLLTRVEPRVIVAPGLLVAAAGMLLLTRVGVDSAYVSEVLPALVLVGMGLGGTMMTAMATATSGVATEDQGVTSAMVNASMQMGGAIGTAVLNTVAATATASYLQGHLASGTSEARRALIRSQGAVHGFSVALWCVVGLLVLTATLAALMLKGGTAREPKGHTAAA
ncbi:MFS transporter [Streptomyces sp. A5-4]|uniref:MFS transporter n=1 Tax=Streptomyces sp. A5-4 TaxID=3384771 RepID=UPI003DA9FDCC